MERGSKSTKGRILIAAAIVAVLFGVASLPVLADYLGPDRTTVAIVTVRATDRDIWTLTNPESPPGTPPVCLIIHTCDEHPSIKRQEELCGWIAKNSGCDEAYVEEERVVELPQATTAASRPPAPRRCPQSSMVHGPTFPVLGRAA